MEEERDRQNIRQITTPIPAYGKGPKLAALALRESDLTSMGRAGWQLTHTAVISDGQSGDIFVDTFTRDAD